MKKCIADSRKSQQKEFKPGTREPPSPISLQTQQLRAVLPQSCFTSVKAEREKGNHTHPTSPHSCAARVPLAKAPGHVGALSSPLQPQVDRAAPGCASSDTGQGRGQGQCTGQQIPDHCRSFTPWNEPGCLLQLHQNITDVH